MSDQMLFELPAVRPKLAKCVVYECQLVRSSTVTFTSERISSTHVAIRVIAELVRPILENAPSEKFMVVTLDTKLKVIGLHQVTVGTLDASLVHPREVFQHALLANASSIILVHNHPSGDTTPSSQDRSVTERLKKCGEMLGIQVVDHIIVGHDDGEWKAISLAES